MILKQPFIKCIVIAKIYPIQNSGLYCHLCVHDRERGHIADFALTRILKVKALDLHIPVEEHINSDIHWAQRVNIELVPHSGIAYLKAIEADFKMNNK